jgi:enoyl-CoA hydratase/carnithine racemase
MSAAELGPEEAKRLGIVLDVFEDDELLPKCEELARRIAANSYMAKTFIKSTLNRHAIGDYREAERMMPAIFASQFMQGAFARFQTGETRDKK